MLDARRIGWAPCGNVRIVLKSVVDEAPLVGIHRLKLQRTARDAHAVSQFSDSLHDAIFAHRTVVFAIDNDFFSVFVSGLQQPVKQKLDGLERLAVTSNEAPAFFGINLQRRVATFVGGFLDLHNETEISRAWCRADPSASSSFSFSGRRNFFERRHGLSFVLIKLQDAEKILCSVIQCQSCRKIVADKQKDQRRKHHHPALRGIARLGRHCHEPNLGRSHAERNDVDRPTEQRQMRYRVRLRKIFYPKKLCVSQFHRLTEHFKETEEDRDLDHHRQTAADRINAVLLVKLHHLLVHPGRIVFVFVAQLLHFRVERGHLAHRAVRFVLDWPKREFDDGGQSQDCETVVMQPTVQQVHEVEQKLADDLEYPEVHDLGLIVRKLRETMVKFRASVDFESARCRFDRAAVQTPACQAHPRFRVIFGPAQRSISKRWPHTPVAFAVSGAIKVVKN